MRDTVQLQITGFRSSVVQDQDGAVPLGEEMLQRENLPTIAKWILGQQPQFRKAVENNSGRICALNLTDDAPDCFS